MTVISVSSLSGLYSALANAKGGETIALAGGEYGQLNLGTKAGFSRDFPSNVTITSADPDNPAVFSTAVLREVDNLTLDGLTFDYSFAPGDALHYRPFAVSHSSNVTIRNSTFDGDVATGVSSADDGYGYAIGLSVRFSSGVVLEQNEIQGFHRGMVVADSQQITVSGNDVHSIRSDGMNFSQVRDVAITDNWIHDFKAAPDSGDHRDMIQFWTAGTTTASENIVIRGNRLDIGNGDFTQSIFMRNELVDTGKAGAELFYKNVLIEENVITNGHLHGITVGETAGLTIRGNTILHADGRDVDEMDSPVEIPRINVKTTSTDVTITGNAVASINGHAGQAGWTVGQNAFVQDQDPKAAGYYGDEFISSSLAPGADPIAVDGGLLDALGAGAAETRAPVALSENGITPMFTVTTDPGDMARVVFDATATLEGAGKLPPGTQFLWQFGDGKTASGAIVAHHYADAGNYQAKLSVILPNMAAYEATSSVKIADPTVLILGSGRFVAMDDAGNPVLLAPDSDIGAGGLAIAAKGVAATVAREHVRDILGADEFSIDLTLKAAGGASAGEVFRLHTSLVGSVDNKGNFQLSAWSEGGAETRLLSSGVNLADKKAHAIAITYEDGVLALSIDGKIVDTEAMVNPLQGISTHALSFGNPWGKANFAGVISSFEVSAGAADFPPVGTTEVLQSLDGLVAMASFDASDDLWDDAGIGAPLVGAEPDDVVIFSNSNLIPLA
jgi:PKD repeat protein